MALVPWPATLPQTIAFEYEGEPVNGLADVEETRNRLRLRTYPEERFPFVFPLLTGAQWRELQRFVREDLLDGCRPFSAPWLPLMGYTHHCCRMLGTLQGEHLQGDWWRATMTVELIALPVMTNGTPSVWM
ncbi:MAG: hypothetical protein LDL30_06710 [Desulfovibrio sp.]|nr:hypothetical protein [Desulfovibrio sp.]